MFLRIDRSAGFLDSSEFALSVTDGSLLHPPSYPLTFLVLRAAPVILPFADKIVAAKMIQVIISSSALFFFFLLTGFFSRNIFLRLAAVLLIFFGRAFQFYAVNLECYAMFFFFTAFFFWAYFGNRRNSGYFNIALFAFAGGIVSHPLFILLIPFVLSLKPPTKPAPLLTAFAFILPFLSYLVLIPASAKTPLLNWEAPSNPYNLLRILIRRGYSSTTFEISPANILTFGTEVLLQSGGLILIWFAVMAKKIKREHVFILTYLFCLGLFFKADKKIFDWTAFVFPVLCMTIPEVSANMILGKKGKVLLAAAALFLFIGNLPITGLRLNGYEKAFVSDIYSRIEEPRTFIFADEDSRAFLLSYYFVKEKNQKIPVITTLLRHKWYRDSLAKYGKVKMPEWEGQAIREYAFLMMSENGIENAYVTSYLYDEFSKEGEEMPHFIVVKITRSGFALSPFSRIEFISKKRSGINFLSNLYENYLGYILNGAKYHARKGDYPTALRYLDLIENPRWEDIYVRSTVYLESGRPSDAVHGFIKVLELQPRHKMSHIGLIRALLASGATEAAEKAYRKCISVFPSDEALKRHLEGFFTRNRPYSK